MKLKTKLLTSIGIALIMLISPHTKAQIEEEIKAFIDSTEAIVNNGRKMLLHTISEKNYTKSKEVYQYLSKITENRNYSAFNINEDLYFNFLIGDWNKINELMLDIEKQHTKVNYPATPDIEYFLYEECTQDYDSLLRVCKESNIDIESKKIIELFVIVIKPGTVREEYNTKLKEFKNEYKASKYDDFLTNYMPGMSYKTSIGFAFGSGMVFPTKDIALDFKPNISLNMSMDVNINRVYSSLYMNGGGLRLKNPFTVYYESDSMNFSQDEAFSYLDMGLKGGYFVVRSKNFHFAPYGSISGSYLKSNQYETADDDLEYEIFDSFVMGAGIHSEVRLKSFFKPYSTLDPTTNYFSLKLDAGYNYLVKHKDNISSGSTPYVMLAIVWAIGEF